MSVRLVSWWRECCLPAACELRLGAARVAKGRVFVIGVVLASCSVYEPSLLSDPRRPRTGGTGGTGGTGSGIGGDPAGGDGSGEAGEGVSRGGASSGGGVATGGTIGGGGDAGDDSGGGSVDTGGAGPTSGGVSNAGAANGGLSTGGAPSGGAFTGGASSGGVSNGGVSNGGTTTGGASKGGNAGGGAAGSGGSAGAAKGGAGGIGGAGGGAPSTGGKSTGGSGGAAGSPGILFSDNFETGNASAWSTSTPSDWSVVTDGSLVYRQGTVVNALRVASAGSASWQNVSIQARVKVLAFGGTAASSSYFAALYARYTDESNHYYVALRSDGKMSIRRKIAGSNASIGSAITPGALITAGTWYTVKLEIVGTTLSASVDGVLYDSVTDTSFASGKIGVGSTNGSAVFDDVVVRLP